MIAYERPDLSEPKESRYRLIEVPEPVEMKEALATVLGIGIVVSKVRRLFVFDGVRIHLDRVECLGDFIEFEGVVANGQAGFAGVLNDLRDSFGIRDEHLVPAGYADLLGSPIRA